MNIKADRFRPIVHGEAQELLLARAVLAAVPHAPSMPDDATPADT